MKRLAAIAVVVALFALPACAQRGGAHGGFSGSHGGGVSAPRGGFSGGQRSGISAAPRPPSGGAVRGGPARFSGFPSGPRGFSPRPAPIRAPGRFAGPGPGQGSRPPQYASHRVPYSGRGGMPLIPTSTGPRQLNGASHRMPYHSPNGGDHRGGWDHRGRDGDRWHDRNRRFGYGVYGLAGYPYWPWLGWGYPFLSGNWDSSDDTDTQGAGYAASQYPEYAPGGYDKAQPEQAQAEYEPWPYSRPDPESAQPAPAPATYLPEPPVTLVFRDGRPNEQIHNYLLTPRTLSVLDRNRRDIPVDQIDLAATAKLNRDAGIEFALPGAGR